jgi:AraC family transcriptional regulator of adaptative response / DNA-3-methyladenine glycosylase II
VRLIVLGGALDGDDACVESLGVGARRLSGLFAHHLNATPIEVAETARVQRAKRLLDCADSPLTEVAIRARFRSLHRLHRGLPEIPDLSQMICQGERVGSRR